MKGRFCPKCGSSDKQFYNGFCVDCYVKDHPGLVTLSGFTVKRCPTCLRVFANAEWSVGDEELINELIKHHVKTSLDDPKITIELLKENPKKADYEVTVEGLLAGNQVLFTLPVTVKFERDTCTVCSRKSGNYYEAIMQLRPKDKDVDLHRIKTALGFLRNEARAFVKKDRQAEIFRYEPVKNGIDVYFGSARTAKVALQHLQSTYHPVVKESYTLKGIDRETGKKRYSVTYSVRL